MAFDPVLIPRFIVLAVLAFLLVVVLKSGFNRTANRAFAIFLVTLAWGPFLDVLVRTGFPFPSALVPLQLQVYIFLLDGFAIILLGLTYPDTNPRVPTWMTKVWPYLVLAGVLDLAYALDHSLYHQYSLDGSRTVGPFVVIDGLSEIGRFLVVAVFFRKAMEQTEPRHARSLLILGIGIGASLLAGRSGFVFGFLTGGFDWPRDFWSQANAVFLFLQVALMLLAIGYLLASGRRVGGERGRLAHRAAAFLLFFAAWGSFLAFLNVGAFGIASPYDPENPSQALVRTLAVALVGMLPVLLVAYGLLRGQLLGIDLKVKIAIRRSTLAGIFVAVFFVASQLAQNFLSGTGGLWVGGMVTGLVLFAVSPLQRAAERVADVAMPGVGVRPGTAGNQQVYREAVEIILADRKVTGREELHLAHLGERLGLGAGEAMRIRLEVQDSLGAARRDGSRRTQ